MSKLPKHIAIIMDGNGRWAKSKGLPRTAGHKQGAETTRKIISECAKLGVKYLTIYAFSSENWNRPAKEVSFLMDLLVYQLKHEVKALHEAGVRLWVIGDRQKLNAEVREAITKAEELTANNDKLNLIIALSYGSRQEILNAVENSGGNIAKFEQSLYTNNIPDPDLLIRTGGEKRISNFLLWQIAYTELYFSDKLWPEFDESDLRNAIEDFSKEKGDLVMLPTSDLKKRFITGIVAMLVGFTAIMLGSWFFFVFVFALSVLISLEFDYLRKDNFNSIILAALPILTAKHLELSLVLTASAVAFPLFAKRLWLAGSVLYITIPAIALIWLREQDSGLSAIVWLVFVVIATDIGGYIAGKLFGKRKLAPTISPNKTWEGLMGGVILAAMLSFIATFQFKFILIGAAFAVVEQISDLMESAIKRHYGVKDTGKILPGHGGVMDRLDGLVLTAPLTAAIVYLGLAAF